MDPRAGEAAEELRSSVEPRRLHRGPDGRTAGWSSRLGQAQWEKGAVEVTSPDCLVQKKKQTPRYCYNKVPM